MNKVMKQLFTLSIILSIAVLSSCTIHDTTPGPQGPTGPQGPQGPQGVQGEQGESGYVMEWESINFTAPDYEVILPYSDFSFEGLDSDVALVYLLWGTEDVNGEILDIWRPLQQIVLTNNGILQYNYDFTKYDVRLFLDANYSLDMLGAIDTDDWVARVVVVPGDFVSNGRADLGDYYDVVEALGLPELPLKGKSVNRNN